MTEVRKPYQWACRATDKEDDGTEHCCMDWEHPHVRPGTHLCMCGHEWPLED